MSKHTPGPWKATEFGSIEYKDGILGEAYDFNPGFDAMEAEKLPHMAYARLMAAAPELLDMVKELGESLTRSNPTDERLRMYLDVRKLIAKIEGNE